MPRVHPSPAGDADSHESTLGDAVPYNGVEDQAARRTHMREQTMARQAAERKAERPLATSRYDRPARRAEARERAADLQAALQRISAGHEHWLRGQAGPPEPTIVEAHHTAGGIVALLSSGELVRLFLVNPTALATLSDATELIGLTVAAARDMAGGWGAFLLPEGDVPPE